MSEKPEYTITTVARDPWQTCEEFNHTLQATCDQIIERGEAITGLQIQKIPINIDVEIPEDHPLRNPLILVLVTHTKKALVPERVEKKQEEA